MKYPKSIERAQLLTYSPDYLARMEFYPDIDLLIGGTGSLKWHLQPHPGEDKTDYAWRLSNFTYTPVMAEALSELETFMGKGRLVIQGCEGPTWNRFRENTTGTSDPTSELELVSRAFRLLVRYQTVYAWIDRPKGTASNLYNQGVSQPPEVRLLDGRHCLDSQPGQWYKFLSYRYVKAPIGPSQKIEVLTIVDSERVVQYETPVDEAGRPMQMSSTKVADTLHNVGRVPVVETALPSELWTAKNLVYLCWRYLAVENNANLTSVTSGQIQRLFNPGNLESPEFINEPKSPTTGNTRTMVGTDFKFAETTGASLDSQMAWLKLTKEQIREVAHNNGLTVSRQGGTQETAAAKALDTLNSEAALQTYGKRLTDWMAQLYQVVALYLGEDPTKVAVTGLETFREDSADEALTLVERLAKLGPTIPAELLAHSIERLGHLLRDDHADTD